MSGRILDDMIVSRISEAVESAQQILEIDAGASIGPCEIAVVLEEILAAEVGAQIGPLPLLRRRLACGDETMRRITLGGIEEALRFMNASFVRELSADPRVNVDEATLERLLLHEGEPSRTFRARIAQRAFERVLSERVAPPLRWRLQGPMTCADVADELPGSYTHTIVVAELIGAVGEIFPLILDAYAYDLAHSGRVHTNVIVVHHSWLSRGETTARAIYYNHAAGALWESDFEVPVAFQSCQFLCLGHNEKQLHAMLASRLAASLQVNSYAVSECCDNKFRTAELLRRAGIRTPKTALLKSDQGLVELNEALTKANLVGSNRLVILPNSGTEGAGVETLTVDSKDLKSLLALKERVLQLSQRNSDEVVVRERVDCLKWTEGVTSIRINVCWDGVASHAESGYLQVAGDADNAVSSVARGGSIVTLSAGAFEGLKLSSEDVAQLRDAACAAVRVIAGDAATGALIGLFGVDLLLERGPDGLFVWILEVNSRPAGLSYSELIATCEPGVSPTLFGALAAHANAHSNLRARLIPPTPLLGISE
jgi:predicted ATP-grasp superfamily ATP-dependent carboligase